MLKASIQRAWTGTLLIALGASIAGCGLGLSYDGAEFCESGDCADDGAADDDADVGAGGCASPASLTATFGGDAIDPGWHVIEADGGTVSLDDGGRLQIASASPASWAALRSNSFYDFRAGAVELEVLDSSLTHLAIEVRDPGDEASVELTLTADQLVASSTAGGGNAAVPYVAEAHRFWRVGAIDDRLQWAASPDRETWTVLRDEAMPDALRFGEVLIKGFSTTEPAAVAHIDDVNPDAPAPVWCGPDDLTDDFDAAALAPQWIGFPSDDCAINLDGAAELAMSAGSGWCALEASRPIDLRDGATFTVEVPIAEAHAYLGLTTATGEMKMSNDPTYGVDAKVDGVDVGDATPLDDARWWRVAGTPGTTDGVTFSVSPDGEAFTIVGVADGVPGLDAVEVTLGSSGSATAAVVQFDNVNLAP